MTRERLSAESLQHFREHEAKWSLNIVAPLVAELDACRAELAAATARAQRAEAQADEAMSRLGGLTESIEQTDRELHELEARAERAEAQRDKLRKVLVAVLGVMPPMTTAQQRVYYDLARDALEATQQPAAAEPASKEEP